jgi:hypothetical protein
VPPDAARLLSSSSCAAAPSSSARGPGGEALLLQSDAAGVLHVLDAALRVRCSFTPHAVQLQRLQHLHQVRAASASSQQSRVGSLGLLPPPATVTASQLYTHTIRSTNTAAAPAPNHCALSSVGMDLSLALKGSGLAVCAAPERVVDARHRRQGGCSGVHVLEGVPSPHPAPSVTTRSESATPQPQPGRAQRSTGAQQADAHASTPGPSLARVGIWARRVHTQGVPAATSCRKAASLSDWRHGGARVLLLRRCGTYRGTARRARTGASRWAEAPHPRARCGCFCPRALTPPPPPSPRSMRQRRARRSWWWRWGSPTARCLL